jgi:hypothetical protein
MRIKFISHEDYECHCIGDEWQGELKAVGHTIVSGHRIAANGILKPFVEDITVYKTEIDEDGKEVKVEVLPEEIPELPTYDGNTIPQIKEFMVAEDISYSYLDGKQDLLDKIHIYYGL